MCTASLADTLNSFRPNTAQFRKLRRSSRSRSGASSLDALGEDFEDRAKWMRIAAALVQSYFRARRAADKTSDRPPAYLRPDWVLPTQKEHDERVTNLAKRFPEVRLGELGSELREYRGHAGYAATALRQRHKERAMNTH